MKRSSAIVVALLAGCVLASCHVNADDGPATTPSQRHSHTASGIRPLPYTANDPVLISTAVGKYDDITAALYDRVFDTTNAGRPTPRQAVTQPSHRSVQEAIESLRASRNTLVLVCAGDLLTYLDASAADKIRTTMQDNVRHGKAPGNTIGKVWEKIGHSLPSDISLTEASNAQCSSETETRNASSTTPVEDVTLPQNIVPIYLKPTMSTQDRRSLTWISGNLGSTRDLEKLYKKTTSAPASRVAKDYLQSEGLAFATDH
ncbi:hypothetical protein ACGE24_03760 [Corynebacterium kroppenstedtii]|uniref:hypothetical protein n=1 Tax=Corynebacterium sp. PCR 32 TaxID=3351342 RepID=UPI003095B82B